MGNRIRDAVVSYMDAHGQGDKIKGYKWEMHLVESKEVNAWCMPGGKVVVYTGILPVTKTDAGLAVVLGHEIGHAVAQHGSERMSQGLLAQMGGVNHGSGFVQLAANPYAAMPSLHSADALIVGITMALVCRHWWSRTLWLLWPAWVWFAVMATGNHFWLDILAGILVAAIAAVVIYRRPILRLLRPQPAAA